MTSLAVNPQIQAPSIEMTAPTSIESGQVGNVNDKEANYTETKIEGTIFTQNQTCLADNNSINNKEIGYLDNSNFDLTPYLIRDHIYRDENYYSTINTSEMMEHNVFVDNDKIYDTAEFIGANHSVNDVNVENDWAFDFEDDVDDDVSGIADANYAINNFGDNDYDVAESAGETTVHDVKLEDTNQPLGSAQNLQGKLETTSQHMNATDSVKNGSREPISSSHNEKKGIAEKIQDSFLSFFKFFGFWK